MTNVLLDAAPRELEWPHWLELADDRRLALANEIRERLGTAGVMLGAPEIHRFGPPERAVSVAQFVHQASGLRLSLVPGGSFRPGFHRDAWLAIVKRVAFELKGIPEDAWTPEHMDKLAQNRLDGIAPYGAQAPWLLDALKASSEEARIDPLLVATTPFQELGRVERLDDVLPRAASLLQPHGFDVPTAFEYEWFLDAGSSGAFYFGDKIPAYGDAAHAAFSPDILRRKAESADEAPYTDPVGAWPEANIFGLRGLLGAPQLCMLDGQDGAAPFLKGGAGFCYPWQGCGEWLWLPTALTVPLQSTESYAWGATNLRPILRLLPRKPAPIPVPIAAALTE